MHRLHLCLEVKDDAVVTQQDTTRYVTLKISSTPQMSISTIGESILLPAGGDKEAVVTTDCGTQAAPDGVAVDLGPDGRCAVNHAAWRCLP